MIKKMIFITLFLLFFFCFDVRGEDIVSMDDFDLSKSSEILKESGYRQFQYKEISQKLMDGQILEVVKMCIQSVYQNTIGNVALVEKTLGNLLLIIILSAFFTNFANVFSRENISATAFFICYLAMITMMVTLFESFCVITVDFVRLLLEFMCGVIPAYFLSVAIIGQVSALGFYQLTLAIIGVSQFVFLNIVIPLIKIYVAISLVNNISQEDLLSKTADLIKNVVTFINKSLVGIVFGLNIIQGLILPAVDGAKNTTIRKFIGSLPVVGDGTDAMTSIVLGSVNLIKNTIGTFAMIVIFLICIVPFLKIQLYSVSVQVVTAIIQPVADRRIVNSLVCMCTGTKMLAKVIMSAALLFIISIAIICMFTGRGS